MRNSALSAILALSLVGGPACSPIGGVSRALAEEELESVQTSPKSRLLGTGIPTTLSIRFEVDKNAMDPSWRIGAVLEALSDEYRTTATEHLHAALRKYPTKILERYLRKIYVFDDMRFDGMLYGGTYDPSLRHVFMTYFPWDPAFIEETFHHEFSSILLLRANPSGVFKDPWKKLADRKALFMDESGYKTLQNGNSSLEYEAAMHEKGFLNGYSASGVEEDFNCFAEALFMGQAKFWNVVDRYPLVKAKAKMAIAFYGMLDKRFTEAYFRGLHSSRLK